MDAKFYCSKRNIINKYLISRGPKVSTMNRENAFFFVFASTFDRASKTIDLAFKMFDKSTSCFVSNDQMG